MFLQHNEQMPGMSLVQVVLEISVGPRGCVRLSAGLSASMKWGNIHAAKTADLAQASLHGANCVLDVPLKYYK